MSRKILLLIMMGFSAAFGGFWALQAQDPPPQTPPSQVRTDPPTVSAQQTVQTDLSGTYTGTFDCEPLGLTGDTTLTITGNDFTTADGKTGRIVASTTRGYTAVALQMGGTAAATTPATTPAAPPVIVSMRARKSGTRLTLTPAVGATMKCSFVPTRVARGRRTPRTPAATGTEVSAPATVPAPTESPMPSQTPAPSPSPTVSPTPAPTPSPTEPAPSPMPTPTPGEPAPSPTPTPSPAEPAPSPTPSPTPTPSPSPRP